MVVPIVICTVVVVAYIGGGAAVLVKWDYSYLDGLFFCFMSLSTIGFGDLISSTSNKSRNNIHQSNQSTWFCAMYILLGMAITATCFNIIHDEINNKLKKSKSKNKLSKHKPDVTNNEESTPSSITVLPNATGAPQVGTPGNNGTFS